MVVPKVMSCFIVVDVQEEIFGISSVHYISARCAGLNHCFRRPGSS